MLKRLISLFAAVMAVGFMSAGLTACDTQTRCVGANCTRAEIYASISEARKQERLLVDANKIPAAKAEEVRGQLRVAQDAVDGSTGLGGDDQLAKARTALSIARTILVSYGATIKP